MRRKAIIIGLSLAVVLGFGGCNLNEKENINKAEEKIVVSKAYKELTLEEKSEIAKKLFEKYIEENKTDIEMVKAQNLKRDPVEALTDYKINDIEILEENKESFKASIAYDIKFTDESNMWVAGNGEIKEDNWCVNKISMIKIKERNGEYVIEQMGTE
ncbi:MAG: hypothetical protein ACRDAU_05365 [Clostridium sp.]